MMLYCEDCRVAVEAIPTIWDADVLEGLTVEDDRHMGHALSNPGWMDTDLKAIDYA